MISPYALLKTVKNKGSNFGLTWKRVCTVVILTQYANAKFSMSFKWNFDQLHTRFSKTLQWQSKHQCRVSILRRTLNERTRNVDFAQQRLSFGSKKMRRGFHEYQRTALWIRQTRVCVSRCSYHSSFLQVENKTCHYLSICWFVIVAGNICVDFPFTPKWPNSRTSSPLYYRTTWIFYRTFCEETVIWSIPRPSLTAILLFICSYAITSCATEIATNTQAWIQSDHVRWQESTYGKARWDYVISLATSCQLAVGRDWKARMCVCKPRRLHCDPY